ncbi:uncharacterized protein LOC107632926 [Arachis ipaensis]|uniref:uncharacterized protein LOC107632926 n=1 Tax=Arachis ipaensis TaxID=130454 RepID=UPI0007AF97AA|nr:uncharacterized protein LOC107632926 [Arachis ipaensis]XP_025638284.1 uncharacterized protein LOC112733522 [Arachis hypogaea]
MGQDHEMLDSKGIAQYIFTMVKADPTISIRVLQGSVKNHFGYKASYRKVWCTYLAFSPCIEAFKHCKPLISIDGTHVYGKYGGTLLMAIAQDGNSNILPIAFAKVEGETNEAWSFFLSYLRQYVTPQPSLLEFCARHIAANFMTHFKNKDLKKVLVNATYSKSHREFAHYFGRPRGENVTITNWLEEMPHSQWTQYADEGRHFGHMTTNISECINIVMKATRNFSITSLVKSTYFSLSKLFARKGSEAQA